MRATPAAIALTLLTTRTIAEGAERLSAASNAWTPPLIRTTAAPAVQPARQPNPTPRRSARTAPVVGNVYIPRAASFSTPVVNSGPYSSAARRGRPAAEQDAPTH